MIRKVNNKLITDITATRSVKKVNEVDGKDVWGEDIQTQMDTLTGSSSGITAGSYIAGIGFEKNPEDSQHPDSFKIKVTPGTLVTAIAEGSDSLVAPTTKAVADRIDGVNSTLSESISKEESRATEEESKLSQSISNETTARINAVSAEAGARETAIAGITSRITSDTSAFSTLDSSESTEEAKTAASDKIPRVADIKSYVDGLNTSTSETIDSLIAEVNAKFNTLAGELSDI